MIDHDVNPGLLRRCQITGSSNLNLVIDLGHQPPCDALLTSEQLSLPEMTYPLRLMHCPDSGLAQLDYVVAGETIYPPSYPYRSGISKPLEEYQRAFADSVVAGLGMEAGSFVVDVGSNDGTLLTGFRRCGMQVLGIEPTDVAKIAKSENGIETIQEFFTENLVKDVVKLFGRARLVTMTNVFAHMAGLGEVMRALCSLLHEDGVFITESHYLMDVLNKNQFDTIYHEHIRTYSLKSLSLLFPQYGLEIFDVVRADRYGGNIRVSVCRTGKRPVHKAVGELLALEEQVGLHQPSTWAGWRTRVLQQRDLFMEFLHSQRRLGQAVAGKSAPGRCATLINFYGITRELIPYLGEIDGSLKLGKFLPGAHIPIVHEERILRENPNVIVLFAWHYASVIAQRLRSSGVTSKMVTPLPCVSLVGEG